MEIDKPRIVYKYHSINRYLFDLLTSGQLWFSHQNELNDPYDCKYALSDNFLTPLLKKSSTTLLKDLQKNDAFKKLDEDSFFEIMLPTFKSNEWMSGLYEMLFDQLGWSVCCFTTNPMNELMWAHYADSNRGVCLEFDLTKTPELHEKLFPVEYNDTFPEVNSMDKLPTALLRKGKVWINESEWRILTNIRGKKDFNKESLNAIHFGYNVDRKNIDKIREVLAESGYSKVGFKQLKFRVKGVTLNPNNSQVQSTDKE